MKKDLTKIVIGLAVLTVFSVAAWGEVHMQTLKSASRAASSTYPGSFSISGTGSDTSEWIDLSQYQNFSYQSKCTSSDGTADYQLVIEVASDMDSTKLGTLSTEFTSDSTEAWTTVNSFFPPVAGAARFSISGVASNPTDTGCWIIVNKERANR